MSGKITNKRGFTLLEVIIAIAALSLIGGVILQMFAASSKLNSRAKASDTALAMAITELEAFKKHSDISDYLGYTPENGDMPLRMTRYYDMDWNHIESGEAPPSDASFSLSVDVRQDAEAVDYEHGVLYIVEVCVAETPVSDGIELARLRTKKYFSFRAGTLL